jgi:exopolysaccharide biosynthesis protein
MNYIKLTTSSILGCIYCVLALPVLSQSSPTKVIPTVKSVTQSKFLERGTETAINGQTISLAWSQWQEGNQIRLGIADTGLMQQLGVELFNTANPTKQPIDWYGIQRSKKPVLNARLSGQYRYLDITDYAKLANWQWRVVSGKLQLNIPPSKVIRIQRINGVNKNQRITLSLDRYTPWKLSQTPTEGYLTIYAQADPLLLSQVNAPLSPTIDNGNLDPDDDPNDRKLAYKVTSNNNQTIVQFPIALGQRAQAKLLNPNTLEIVTDNNTNALPDRSIAWTPGLIWKQQWIALGNNNFPVAYLQINPRQKGLKIKPVLSLEPNLVGTNHLIKFAPTSQLAAAINGGYFNRNTRMPLGAIKQDGKWLSSPILNRGAIAWNERGQVRIARLQVDETLYTSKGEELPILATNSGYAQTGLARYTSSWGSTYRPIQGNELIITVQQDKVTQILAGSAPGSINVPIPTNGYLLALRAQPELSSSLAVGTVVTVQKQVNPPDFDNYPHILAAGPWLLQGGKILLDGKGENFSNSFVSQSAVRSAIGQMPTGDIILLTVHHRAGGKGPTLAEMAQIVQKMGVSDALNLDGGSSTSLYLGGQLIDRAAATAARVHNAIGIFIDP